MNLTKRNVILVLFLGRNFSFCEFRKICVNLCEFKVNLFAELSHFCVNFARSA